MSLLISTFDVVLGLKLAFELENELVWEINLVSFKTFTIGLGKVGVQVNLDNVP